MKISIINNNIIELINVYVIFIILINHTSFIKVEALEKTDYTERIKKPYDYLKL